MKDGSAGMSGRAKKKRKSQFRGLRFRKRDPQHNLCAATQHYVHSKGGTVAIIGGIEIQHYPNGGPYRFLIAIRCTGKPPVPTPTETLSKAGERE